MLDVLPALWDTLCVKLQLQNLCMTFQRRTEDQTLCTLFSSLFSTYPICKSRQFANVCTYPQIEDCPRLECCPRSDYEVSEYDHGWQCLHTHTHTHTNKQTHNTHVFFTFPPSIFHLSKQALLNNPKIT